MDERRVASAIKPRAAAVAGSGRTAFIGPEGVSTDMEVALLTVGDEILAGDTVNTNASWLASRITERGGTVARILTVPDDAGVIAEYVREWSDGFDAVVVTGGLGGTPDDVTMDAVADALDRDLVVDEEQRDRLRERSRRFLAENPEWAERYEFDLDPEAGASLPRGGRALATDAGWAPGCAVGNVYVLPGVPDEMKAMFELVEEEFGGDAVSGALLTPTPEGALGDVLAGVREEFPDAAVGSYPGKGETPGRLKVTATDPERVEEVLVWLRERVETVDPDGGESDGDVSDGEESDGD